MGGLVSLHLQSHTSDYLWSDILCSFKMLLHFNQNKHSLTLKKHMTMTAHHSFQRDFLIYIFLLLYLYLLFMQIYIICNDKLITFFAVYVFQKLALELNCYTINSDTFITMSLFFWL